jgi:hypothetical protein
MSPTSRRIPQPNLCRAQARHRQLAWTGVPFYFRTGKYLCARNTEIAVQFRQAPYALFRDTPVDGLPANILTLRIQPDEGLSLSFSAKHPGAEIENDGVDMDFAYRDYFAPLASATPPCSSGRHGRGGLVCRTGTPRCLGTRSCRPSCKTDARC